MDIAESTAKAAVFRAWRDEQCDRGEAVLGKMDELIEAFRQLETWTDRGRALQIPLLDLRIGAGQLHADGVSEMRDKFRAILDQEAQRQA